MTTQVKSFSRGRMIKITSQIQQKMFDAGVDKKNKDFKEIYS